MKIVFFIIVGLSLSLSAYTKEDMIKDYENKEYEKVCLKRASYYKNSGNDEKLLTIIGDSCAKIDYINPLGYVVRGLVSTPEFRENGSYFATLILQKKLIYQFMNDGIDLKNLRLPQSKHVLSVVFENLAIKNYTKVNEKLLIKTNQKEYKVWIDNQKKRVVHIDEYVDGKKIKTHGYL